MRELGLVKQDEGVFDSRIETCFVDGPAGVALPVYCGADVFA